MIFSFIKKLPLIITLFIAIYFGHIVQSYTELIKTEHSDVDPYEKYLSLDKSHKMLEVYIDKAKIKVELATTEEQRQVGLMYRFGLNENQGMLFVFDNSDDWAMWMKNTYIPLDIMWFDRNFTLVHVEHSVPPCTQLICPSYKPPIPASYVLETNAGWAFKNNIKVGSKLIL